MNKNLVFILKALKLLVPIAAAIWASIAFYDHMSYESSSLVTAVKPWIPKGATVIQSDLESVSPYEYGADLVTDVISVAEFKRRFGNNRVFVLLTPYSAEYRAIEDLRYEKRGVAAVSDFVEDLGVRVGGMGSSWQSKFDRASGWLTIWNDYGMGSGYIGFFAVAVGVLVWFVVAGAIMFAAFLYKKAAGLLDRARCLNQPLSFAA